MRLMTLNMAGGSRNAMVAPLAQEFAGLIAESGADVILCQEAMRRLPAVVPPDDLRNLARHNPEDAGDLLGSLNRLLSNRGFAVYFSPALLSNRDSHPYKWKEKLRLPDSLIQAQGNALILKTGSGVFTRDFWTGHPCKHSIPIEASLPLGKAQCLYRGNRDSEPRIAQGLRVGHGASDLVIWNVHLTTLEGEREADLSIDERARAIRQDQLSYLSQAFKFHSAEGEPANWIIGGDFNQDAATLADPPDPTPFRLAISAPTRPNGGETDNFMLDTTIRLPQPPRILVSSQFDSPPENQEHFDTAMSGVIDNLITHGLDHFPVIIEIASSSETIQRRRST